MTPANTLVIHISSVAGSLLFSKALLTMIPTIFTILIPYFRTATERCGRKFLTMYQYDDNPIKFKSFKAHDTA
jgi:hypothetical protein